MALFIPLAKNKTKNKDTKLITAREKWRNKPSGKQSGNGYPTSKYFYYSLI